MNGFERLGQRIAHEQDVLRARDATLTRNRLRESVADAQPTRPRALRHALWIAPSLSAACGLIWFAWSLREPSLTVVAGASAPLSVGAFVEANAREPLAMNFSDGTRIEIAPSTRARLVELDADGAELALETGLAHVHVRHRPTTHYRLSAGPFRVLVTGTRFDVRWNPEADAFELELREGHVEVSGCAFGPGYRMRAGQRVRASCKLRRFDVSESGKAEPAAAAARSVPGRAVGAAASESEAASRAPRARSVHASAPVEHADWVALAQHGNYVEAFAAADAAGFEAQCARSRAHELAMLADAARFAGASKREAYALHSMRRRFAGSEQATLAAFALGRLEFDRHRAYQKAAQWFDTYLSEQPSGPLSREARGRLIEATVRAGDFARARSLADAYVRDYPGGPHANLARSLQATSEH